VATRRLHIHYCSLNRWAGGSSEDVKTATNSNADIIAFDEVTNARSALPGIARANGYVGVTFPGGEEAFMIREDHKIIARGRQKVSSAVAHSPSRYVNWVGINWHGQKLWPHVAHWIVHVAAHGKVTTTADRQRQNLNITKGMIRQVNSHGKNPNLAFFMGDTNINEESDNHVNSTQQINYNFRKNGLITVWDEMRVYPATLGGSHGPTYDVIGKYDPKRRVTAVRYKTWPMRNSDHRPISAWYDIDMKKPAASSASSGGSPSTPLKTYQWWDYSDYMDSSIYELSVAMEDSGDPDD
jgi:hypothetical protein